MADGAGDLVAPVRDRGARRRTHRKSAPNQARHHIQQRLLTVQRRCQEGLRAAVCVFAVAGTGMVGGLTAIRPYAAQRRLRSIASIATTDPRLRECHAGSDPGTRWRRDGHADSPSHALRRVVRERGFRYGTGRRRWRPVRQGGCTARGGCGPRRGAGRVGPGAASSLVRETNHAAFGGRPAGGSSRWGLHRPGGWLSAVDDPSERQLFRFIGSCAGGTPPALRAADRP